MMKFSTCTGRRQRVARLHRVASLVSLALFSLALFSLALALGGRAETVDSIWNAGGGATADWCLVNNWGASGDIPDSVSDSATLPAGIGAYDVTLDAR